MQALCELSDKRPYVEGLAEADFWAILGKFMSRNLPPSRPLRTVCDEHFVSGYAPIFGAPDNLDRLVEDICSVGAGVQVALSTEIGCWREDWVPNCAQCTASKITRIYDPIPRGGRSNALADAWRSAYLSDHRSDYSMLEAFASEMFPAIEFADSAWSKLGSLDGSPQEIVEGVISHLGVLNDFVVELWNREVTTGAREAQLRALGVVASMESPNTHRNRTAMRARSFKFGERTVLCEWHTKLRPDVNRIHFAVNEGRVFVGTIIGHLPT